jgi:hypothetical protein
MDFSPAIHSKPHCWNSWSTPQPWLCWTLRHNESICWIPEPLILEWWPRQWCMHTLLSHKYKAWKWICLDHIIHPIKTSQCTSWNQNFNLHSKNNYIAHDLPISQRNLFLQGIINTHLVIKGLEHILLPTIPLSRIFSEAHNTHQSGFSMASTLPPISEDLFLERIL